MYEYFERLLYLSGKTAAEVCKDLGINQAVISTWKSRNSMIGARYMKMFADYFKVPMDYFVDGNMIDLNNIPELPECDDTINEDQALYAVAQNNVDFLVNNPEYFVLVESIKKVEPTNIDRVKKMIDLFCGSAEIKIKEDD